jgi:hypothetical protein
MKLIPFIIPLMAVFTRTLADPYTVTFNGIYDNGGAQTNTFAPACANKLASNYPTFGSFSTFPRISGASFVTNSNNAACGSCWRLTSMASNGIGNKNAEVIVAVINSATSAVQQFTVSAEVFNTLANDQLVQSISVNAEPIQGTICGFTQS